MNFRADVRIVGPVELIAKDECLALVLKRGSTEHLLLLSDLEKACRVNQRASG
jgi:hypothetical protein